MLSFGKLQQQGRVIAGDEQPNGAECADDANADHLECNIDQAIAVEQYRALFRHGVSVGFECRAGHKFVRVISLIAQLKDQLWSRPYAPTVPAVLQQLRIALAVRIGRGAQSLQLAFAQLGIVNVLQHTRCIDARAPC